MAKKTLSVYEEVDSQARWDELMESEGLFVIEIFQKWCGFCKALNNSFMRTKSKFDKHAIKLNFVAAQADTIDVLKRYRGRCEPCFLFFSGGVMIGVERGANVPHLDSVIEDLMDKEAKVAENLIERVEVSDPIIAQLEEEERRLMEEQENADEVIEIEVTLMIIKPDAIVNGYTDEILTKLKAEGFEILLQEERHLTEEQASRLYAVREMMDYFSALIDYMCSGPSIVLVVTRGDCGAIDGLRELMGPPNVEEARQSMPNCWRSLFGTTGLQNGIHGSDSYESSMRELAFFFPDFVNPTRIKEKPKLENTLAIIRPDAVIDFRDDIVEKIIENHFSILIESEIEMSEEMFLEFYEHVPDSLYRDRLMDQMLSGPSLFLLLRKLSALSEWRDLIGPRELPQEDEGKDSDELSDHPIVNAEDEAEADDVTGTEEVVVPLRHQFTLKGILVNLIHGSETYEDAEREINFIWPLEHVIAVVKPDGMEHHRDVEKTLSEAGFVIAGRKSVELQAWDVERLYPQLLGAEFFPALAEHMMSAPVLVFLLSANKGLERLREMIGSTNPEDDKDEEKTIRGRFGEDTLHNVIHAPSTPEACEELILHFFGNDLHFDEHGHLVEDEGPEEEEGDEGAAHSQVDLVMPEEDHQPVNDKFRMDDTSASVSEHAFDDQKSESGLSEMSVSRNGTSRQSIVKERISLVSRGLRDKISHHGHHGETRNHETRNGAKADASVNFKSQSEDGGPMDPDIVTPGKGARCMPVCSAEGSRAVTPNNTVSEVSDGQSDILPKDPPDRKDGSDGSENSSDSQDSENAVEEIPKSKGDNTQDGQLEKNESNRLRKSAERRKPLKASGSKNQEGRLPKLGMECQSNAVQGTMKGDVSSHHKAQRDEPDVRGVNHEAIIDVVKTTNESAPSRKVCHEKPLRKTSKRIRSSAHKGDTKLKLKT